MKNLQLLKNTSLFCSTLSCVLPVSQANAASPTETKRPNILIIQCDQQRYDCLGYTGNPIVKTPNIDRLAAQGMQFTRAYTPIPTSCPARQCLLSGQWPEQHGGLWNYDITLPVRLFDSDTWTERLHDEGYRTGYVGKWHVHPTKTPLDFGFDDYVNEAQYAAWLKNEGKRLHRINTGQTAMMGGYDSIDKETASVHWFVRQAIELIRKYESEGKPWHLRLDYVEPHLPCYPVKEFYDRYVSRAIPQWPNFPDDLENKPYIQRQQILNWALEDYTWADWERYMRSYYAVVEQVDDAIGMLVEELEKEGLTDRTMIVYTADHGDAAGSHGMLDKHYVMYEEEVHVPLIVRWDGVVEAGSRCDAFVCHALDLAATIPEIAGFEFASAGASLMSLLTGQCDTTCREYAFSNYNGQQFGLFVQRMVRDGRYKYVWTPTDTDEFYDLQEDPYEMTNQIGNPAYAPEVARLRKVLYEDLVKRKDAAAGNPSAAKRQLLEGMKH